MNDPARRLTLRTGYWLLAVAIPFGLTLEALHGFKVRAFVQSEMRSELFRLAHAHGTLLGILCLVFAALAEKNVPEASRLVIARLVAWGAVLMPLGFFFGGILNSEGDPSLGIVLTPLGAVLLVVALVRAAQGTKTPPRDSSSGSET
jgi:Na+-driven multidrug efflux pump